MSPIFALNYAPLRKDERLAALAKQLAEYRQIDSGAVFNSFCRAACRSWAESFREAPLGRTSPLFAELLERLQLGGEAVICTGWGGVVIQRHEHPQVEKYLVVRQGGYLALEKHEQKDEHLEVQEGAGLLLWREQSGELTVQAITPGDTFHFEPGREHCLIGTEDLLVFECSTDPKGMDQDLIFLYEPDGQP